MFLDYPQIPFENNCAERMIRPAVILPKNSQSNRLQPLQTVELSRAARVSANRFYHRACKAGG